MTRYHENKHRAITKSAKPTLTDQSAAKDTDINIIVGQFLTHGHAPGNARQPIEDADFTKMPRDLRGFIEEARSLDEHKRKLPDQLKDMQVEEILRLTPEQLTTILTPPKPAEPAAPAPQPEGAK